MSFSEEDERKALAEYKVAVVDVLKELAIDGDLEIWGVKLVEGNEVLVNTSGSSSKKVENVLLKFLRGADLDVKFAVQRIAATIKWRREFGTDKIAEEKFKEEFSKVGFMHKTDREGSPVLYNVYGALPASEIFHDLETFLRWRVQLMESSLKYMDFETVTSTLQIHDYADVNMLSMDSRTRLAVRETVKLFQDHYPEFLERKFFINVPWFMAGLYNVVKVFVSARTQAKFQMCSDDYRSVLIKYIPVKNIPVRYGGMSRDVGGKEDDHDDHDAARRAQDIEPTCAKIPSQSAHSVEIKVPVQSRAHWEFVLVEKDIKLVVTSAADEGNGKQAGAPTTVTDRMVKAEEGLVEGSFAAADKPATLTLTWSNEYSIFSAKEVYHRHVIVPVTVTTTTTSTTATATATTSTTATTTISE